MTPAGSDTAAPSVLRMAGPLVVSFVMRAAFTFVDTIYAALIGDAAVAGIGIAVPFEFVMIAVWVGLSTGLTSGLSRAMGANETRKIEQYLKAAWTLVLIASPLLLLLGLWIWFLFPRGELSDEVFRSFRIYGSVLIGGSAFTAFWSIIPDSLVKAHHDTRSTMWAGIISNVINLSLNTLFLFVFHWGIFGIAFSTVLGRIGGLVYALGRASHHERIRKAAGGEVRPDLDPKPFYSILSLAVPSSLAFVLMAMEVAVINFLISLQENNTEALAAYSIYYRMVLFALNPIIAAAVAMLPYAARRFGTGDISGVWRGLRETHVASVVYSFGLVAPVMFLSAGWIASSMGESPLTVQYTTFALWIIPFVTFFSAPFLLCRPVFEGMQRGRPGLVVAVARYAVLMVPVAWLGMVVAEDMGIPVLYGLLVGLMAVSAVTSGAFYLWLRSALRAYEGTLSRGAEPAEARVPEMSPGQSST